jgi:Phytanoyl-CoA dioxygenase (PhyH)
MTSNRDIAPLEASNALLDNPMALHEKWDRDGCLFFRDVLDHTPLREVRKTYMRVAGANGLLIQHDDIPLYSGRGTTNSQFLDKLVDGSVWRNCVAHPSFEGILTRILGKRPVWLPIVVQRCVTPGAGSEDIFAGRHQDAFFNAGLDFVNCWIPLDDMEPEVGGLAVVPGSHKAETLHDATKPPMFPIPPDAISENAWRRPSYHLGDIVIFNMRLVHAGLPNTSNKLRLSFDVRAVAASATKPIIGRVSGLDGNRVRIDTDDGQTITLLVDDDTYVRGRMGNRMKTSDIENVLPPGSPIIATTDDGDRAKLVRPASY